MTVERYFKVLKALSRAIKLTLATYVVVSGAFLTYLAINLLRG